MINHSLNNDIVSISIDKIDFSYRIPINKIGKTTNWKIGEKDAEGIVVKDVSKWMLQLFTKNTTEDKYIKQFKSIVQEYAPKSSINWDDTLMAVNIQNEYSWLVTTNKTADEKMTDNEILSTLEKKYNL